MKLSIFGLGYVGAVSSACFAEIGHDIIGVDRDSIKVDLINEGKTPVIEKKLEQLIKLNVKEGRLRAITDPEIAVQETEISMICVGTPSNHNGSIDLSSVERVSCDIGSALLKKEKYHLVVARSTILPGTVQNTIIPILEKESGKKAGQEFGVIYNPEFIREASAVDDFFHPPKTVIGAINAKDGQKISQLYKNITAPLLITTIRIAEMIKYADNIYHALKITFANEIGLLCKSLGIDPHEVMNLFCQDTKLNLSSCYLKPGFAFGGSCLPKDLRAITHLARHQDLDLPVLNAIIPSNQSLIQHALNLIKSKEKKKIGFLGFAFKAGTDDLRESPVVTLIEILLGQGYEIKIYDKNVSLARLRGSNKKFIEERVPHIAALMNENIQKVISFSEILVVGNKSDEFDDILKQVKQNQYVIDLVRITEQYCHNDFYEGVCW
jgi:GDP-mannose 6-dehydrogenase